MAVRPIDRKALEKKISEWLGQPGNGDYYSGYDAALCAVQDLIADMPNLTPPNEPLTLEQLREMNEEPVWVQNLEEPEKSQWRLLYWDRGKYLVLQGISVRGYLLEEYGKSWLAYHRPPEGESDA